MKLVCRDCDKYLECVFNGRKGNSQICKNFTNNFKMIRELKEIKSEIIKQSFEVKEKNGEEFPVNYTENIMQIIDNHIKKLKGEQNDE